MTEATIAKPERHGSSDSTGSEAASRRILSDNHDTTTVAARTEPRPEPTHLVMTDPYAAAAGEGQTRNPVAVAGGRSER